LRIGRFATKPGPDRGARREIATAGPYRFIEIPRGVGGERNGGENKSGNKPPLGFWRRVLCSFLPGSRPRGGPPPPTPRHTPHDTPGDASNAPHYHGVSCYSCRQARNSASGAGAAGR